MPDNMTFPSFRDQAPARSPWELNEDARRGFSTSVNNNQPQMALYYVQELVKEYDDRLAALTQELQSLQSTVGELKKAKPAAAAPRAAAKKAEDTKEG